MPDLPIFLFLLLLLAVFLRNDLILYIFYLFAGLYLIGGWWARRALPQVAVTRHYVDRLFQGERGEVELEVVNGSWLPLTWVQLFERVPSPLRTAAGFRAVVSLAGRGRTRLRYDLLATRRGYYELGPMQLRSGDLLGMRQPVTQELAGSPLIVYPKIVPIPGLGLPSRTPFGKLRHAQRLFEDPTRLIGTREYQPGDSWRRINWKASAATGTWQIKQLEPAISLETMIVLNLNEPEYDVRRWSVSSELGVTTAASLAHAIVEAGQAVGLLTHGRDPLASNGLPPQLPPREGRTHLMLLLEQLARVAVAPLPVPFAERLRTVAHEAPWGATILVVTPNATPEVLGAAGSLRRAGFSVTLAITDPRGPPAELRAQGAAFGLGVAVLYDEASLARWPMG